MIQLELFEGAPEFYSKGPPPHVCKGSLCEECGDNCCENCGARSVFVSDSLVDPGSSGDYEWRCYDCRVCL